MRDHERAALVLAAFYMAVSRGTLVSVGGRDVLLPGFLQEVLTAKP